MSIEFVPDIGGCRLCGATTEQREFWPETYLGAGQSLRRCGHCAGLYLAPDFTPHALDDFYRHQYRQLFLTEIVGKDPELFFRQRFEDRIAEERARLVAPLLPEAGRLFELGSGFGSFLGAMAQARPDVALHAAEHDTANRTIRCQGAKVQWTGDFEAFSRVESFDLVAAFHVLEHLPRPTAFARWVADVLNPGGSLVVEVPDAGSGWNTRKFIHPAHLTYFTASSLRRTLQSAGLDIVRCGKHPLGGPFAATLLAIARRSPQGRQVAPMTGAEAAEIAAIDRHVELVRSTLLDGLKTHAKRAMTKLLGKKRTGALQRHMEYRRMKRYWQD